MPDMDDIQDRLEALFRQWNVDKAGNLVSQNDILNRWTIDWPRPERLAVLPVMERLVQLGHFEVKTAADANAQGQWRITQLGVDSLYK